MDASSRPKRFDSRITVLQVLLQLLDFSNHFANFGFSIRRKSDNVSSLLFNSHNTRIMVIQKIGKHTVKMYDTIDELPIVRFHKYQKYILVDSGIGGDLQAFDSRLEKTRRFIQENKTDQAMKELQNLRQGFYFIQTGLMPKHRAFAALVTEVDGKEYELSDANIEKIVEVLSDVSIKELADQIDSVKKKIDDELMLYFPKMFNDAEVKEYFDILKRRTIEIFNNIIKGKRNPDISTIIDKLTSKLITYSNPKVFTGSDGVEVQFDRQFENLCLVLSEQLHVKPKEYTVMEFYNAFDFIQEKARKAKKSA